MNGDICYYYSIYITMIADIQSVIAKYLFEWKLREGIDINKINWNWFVKK